MNNTLPAGLSNTPGIYYALAYWMSSVFYVGMNPHRITGWKLRGVQVLFLLGLVVFMVATDGIDIVLFLPCILLDVLMMFLCLKICCDMDWKKAAYFCVRAFILGEFAASIEWQLFYYGLTRLQVPLNFKWNLVFLVLSHGMVFGIMFLLERKYREGNAKLQISYRELAMTILIGLLVYALSNLSYIFQNTPFSSQFTTEIFIIRTLVDLGGLGMLFAYHMQLQELNIKLEMEFLQNVLYMQYENYKISQESIALVDQKYHDLKHQIELLRSEVGAEEKLAYLDQMEQEIRVYETQNKTGNKVLDTILTTKSLQCQNQGISLTCVADGNEIDFMHPMDISALFGNALDNAIESVKKLNDPEKRLIHVSLARQKNFVKIRVENYYEGEILFENGMPATTKKNKKYHGFGIKSIQRTVEKYGGSLTIDTKDCWFEVRILFPR